MYKHTNFSSDNLLKLGVALICEHKLTLSEVRFEIDNWPKVGDALYREHELISKRIQYYCGNEDGCDLLMTQ